MMPSAIRTLYTELMSLSDSASDTARRSELVAQLTSLAISESPEAHDLSPSEVRRVQEISSKCEYDFESAWAAQLANAPNPWKALSAFPEIEHYRSLVGLGWQTLRLCCGHDHSKVLFVGSGPLPLTAILLATQHGATVTCLEYNPAAVAQSRKVITALNLADVISVEAGDALSYTKYNQFEVVMIAALVGAEQSDAEKEEIFRIIKAQCRPRTHVLTRSSYSARTLLYRPLPQSIYTDLKFLAEIRPQGDVINSILVFNT